MKSLVRAQLTVGLALALTACGAIPSKNFEIRARDFQGAEVPCLVVVDREFDAAAKAEKYSDCSVVVAFDKPRVNVKVYPTEFGADGKIVVPDPSAEAPYYPESRDLTIDDPRTHLFLLRRNLDYVGN